MAELVHFFVPGGATVPVAAVGVSPTAFFQKSAAHPSPPTLEDVLCPPFNVSRHS